MEVENCAKILVKHSYKINRSTRIKFMQDYISNRNKEEALLFNNIVAVQIEKKLYNEELEAKYEGLKVLEVYSSFLKKAKLFVRKAKIYSLYNRIDRAIQLYEKSLVEDHVQSVKDELKKLQKLQKDMKAQIQRR